MGHKSNDLLQANDRELNEVYDRLKASQDEVSELTKTNSLLREALEYIAKHMEITIGADKNLSTVYRMAQQALETEDGVQRRSLNKEV